MGDLFFTCWSVASSSTTSQQNVAGGTQSAGCRFSELIDLRCGSFAEWIATTSGALLQRTIGSGEDRGLRPSYKHTRTYVYKLTTTTTVLQPLFRTTCISRHLPLRTGGFLLGFHCPHALADGNQHNRIREKMLSTLSPYLQHVRS